MTTENADHLTSTTPAPAPPLAALRPGFVRIARPIARAVQQAARLADPCCRSWPRLIVAATLIGALPIGLGALCGSGWHQPLSALPLAAVVWSCARRGDWRQGMASLAVAFLVHSLVALGLASQAPAIAAEIFPDAEAYWQRQQVWIQTGRDPEYELRGWGPAHVQLACGTTLYSFTSLGVVTLAQGFYEVDLMNYYNARLWDQSRSGVRSLFWGWHVWSLLRGLGYVILTYEVVALAVGFFSGERIRGWSDRLRRAAVGAGCLIADAGTKWLMLDVVRRQLFDNLL
ncbi:MAG: hypothetical protein ACKV0T_26100 [Planctomycetales bacterium]